MSIAVKLIKYLNSFFKLNLKDADKELYKSIEEEFSRQQNHIELIASENIVSKAVVQPLCITAKALCTQAVIDSSRIT